MAPVGFGLSMGQSLEIPMLKDASGLEAGRTERTAYPKELT